MSHLCAPVFLGANRDEDRTLIRTVLAAHPRFFTSHLPSDDAAAVRSWAEAMAETPCSRRPVWLSEAAFECVDELKRFLPEARFVRVVSHSPQDREGLLEVDTERLHADLPGELARILSFLGEESAPEHMRRCA